MTAGEQTDRRPRTAALRAVRLRQHREHAQRERQASELRRRLEQRADFDRLPAVRARRTAGPPPARTETARPPRSSRSPTDCFIISTRPGDARSSAQCSNAAAGRDRAPAPPTASGHQIDDEPFRDHRDLPRAAAEIGEQAAAAVLVRQIEAHALELAHRLRVAEDLFLVVEDVGQIDFHPAQRRRQRPCGRAACRGRPPGSRPCRRRAAPAGSRTGRTDRSAR